MESEPKVRTERPISSEEIIRINPKPIENDSDTEAKIKSLDIDHQKIIHYASGSREMHKRVIDLIWDHWNQSSRARICIVHRNGKRGGITAVKCSLCPNATLENLQRFSGHLAQAHLDRQGRFRCFDEACHASFSFSQSRDRHEQNKHRNFRPKAYERKTKSRPVAAQARMNHTSSSKHSMVPTTEEEDPNISTFSTPVAKQVTLPVV